MVFYSSLQYLSLELLIRNQQVGAKCNLELIMLKCTNGVKYIFASVADNTGAQWVSGDRKNRRISPGPLIGPFGRDPDLSLAQNILSTTTNIWWWYGISSGIIIYSILIYQDNKNDENKYSSSIFNQFLVLIGSIRC